MFPEYQGSSPAVADLFGIRFPSVVKRVGELFELGRRLHDHRQTTAARRGTKRGVFLGCSSIEDDDGRGVTSAWHHAVGGNEGGLSRREIGQG